MKTRTFLLGLALATVIATGSAPQAATFKWANDGDVRALDPYTFNETVLQGWTPGTYDAHNVFYTLLSPRAPDGRGQGNNGGYANPRVDQLTDAMSHEFDKEKRQELINEASRIVEEDVATIPLHQQVIVWAARDTIDLVQPADNAFYLRWVRVK